jgi:hypothetical protein
MSNTTPIKNSDLGDTTSMIHQSPFGGVNKWGTPIVAPTFTPSSYITLQAMTSTPIYTMQVNSSSKRIEKFRGRLDTISLKEFKATFSTMVCGLKFKYGTNYIDVFAFKQLARYVQYEALDVYEQHFPRILGATQIPNLTYATAIAIASQVALQATIAHHGTVSNNPNPVPTSINISPQQLIAATVNIPPTINAPAFVDPVQEFFQILELEFLIKSSEQILQLATFSRQKDETFKMLYKRLLKLKEDTQSITNLEATHRYLC